MLLTVFTPTYNREGLLKRAYESLLNQTDGNFCWLIVDDGSTDNTRELVADWIKEGRLQIRYEYCRNGGKMRAHNTGVRLCETELFLCLDSDDYLTKTAVEEISACWREAVKTDGKKMPAGIVAYKGKSETELLSGTEFPYTKDTRLYHLYLNGFRGETTLIFRTDILKEFPFPEIEGEKYVPEDYIYDKIDTEHVLRVLPRIITVCELVSSGYTDSVAGLKQDNPNAWFLYYEQRARITPFSVLKLKYLAYYIVYAKRCKKPLFKATGMPFFFVLLGLPGALVLKLTGRK
ncbi:MAG TPA: glycosyltransferase family 2 protein [Lachnospiraceae bacterium]|nr:glycosyltransferase family 2 protein [Lachnospiraceae bacterium]